jgi:hypothetical protein
VGSVFFIFKVTRKYPSLSSAVRSQLCRESTKGSTVEITRGLRRAHETNPLVNIGFDLSALSGYSPLYHVVSFRAVKTEIKFSV